MEAGITVMFAFFGIVLLGLVVVVIFMWFGNRRQRRLIKHLLETMSKHSND